jgi:hypothetical protein
MPVVITCTRCDKVIGKCSSIFEAYKKYSKQHDRVVYKDCVNKSDAMQCFCDDCNKEIDESVKKSFETAIKPIEF